MKKSIEMNNISIFLSAAERYGVNVSDLFQVSYLWKNWSENETTSLLCCKNRLVVIKILPRLYVNCGLSQCIYSVFQIG